MPRLFAIRMAELGNVKCHSCSFFKKCFLGGDTAEYDVRLYFDDKYVYHAYLYGNHI